MQIATTSLFDEMVKTFANGVLTNDPASARPPTLAEFCNATTPIWNTEPWQDIICERLGRLVWEKGQHILIHAPPQFGKSWITSARFPAWLLGMDPLHKIRLVAYGQEHAEHFSAALIDIMLDDEYARMFPNPKSRLRAFPRPKQEEWSTAGRVALRDGQPSFKPVGIGSALMGLGADCFIIDDPYKSAEEADSERINDIIWQWWTETAKPRLRPETNVVVMFHRWREYDFAGRLLESMPGQWESMRFPALADGEPDDPTIAAGLRKEGESLSPDRFPVPFLLQRQEQDPAAFRSLYQGTPINPGGNFFPMEHIRLDANRPSDDQLRIFQAWDLALSEKQGADYTACATLGVDRALNAYILDMVRGHWSPAATVQQIGAQADKWHPELIGIESHGFQSTLFQEAVKTYHLPFRELKHKNQDKQLRAQLLRSRIETGKVFVNPREPWWPALKEEMLAFPKGKRDDQVDALAYVTNMAGIRREVFIV